MTTPDDSTASAAPDRAPIATVGVIGGSGVIALLDEARAERVRVSTPYGAPSSEVLVGELAGHRVAFLPRHGDDHRLAPHEINARANVWALAHLGVRAIVSTNAVGSLDAAIPPESLVVPDQLLDRTWGRADTYFGGGVVEHVPFADPFCPELHRLAVAALRARGEAVIGTATTAVVQGPRFSTRAESQWLRQAGASLVNMTQYPETVLAAELNVGLVNLSFVTDTDTGRTADDADTASASLVFERMARAAARLRQAVGTIVAAIPQDYAPRQLLDERVVARLRAGAGRSWEVVA